MQNKPKNKLKGIYINKRLLFKLVLLKRHIKHFKNYKNINIAKHLLLQLAFVMQNNCK